MRFVRAATSASKLEARVGPDGGEGEADGFVAMAMEAGGDGIEDGRCVPCSGDEEKGWLAHGD